MKIYKYILFLFLISFKTYGQKISQREIIRSGKYYYSTSYAKDSLNAKDKAKKGLFKVIGEELAKQNKQVNNGKVLIKHIQYFILPLTSEVKAIAYIQKENLKTLPSLSSVEIKEQPIDSIRVPKKIKKQRKTKIKAVLNKSVVKKVIKKDSAVALTKNHIPKNISPILKELLQSVNTDELLKKLKNYNKEGKIQLVTNVNKYSSRFSDKGFYKILIDKSNKTFTGIIDKNSNRNLKTDKEISKDNIKKHIQLWLKIY